jgi:uncharacterized protein (UPF0335 family)
MGRPKKEVVEVAFDVETVKEYVSRWFTLENEIKGLREEKTNLKDEFKGKVDFKLISVVVRMVKAQLKLTASEETVQQLEEIIKDKIGAVLD